MDYKECIFSLSECVGLSGFEYEVGKHIKTYLENYTNEVTIDPLGNVRGTIRCGKPNAKRVLLDAHMDEIGLMVQGIDKNGFLRFCALGGIDPRILPGALVRVCGREVLFGVVSVKPPHIQTQEEEKKALSLSDLVIDVGFSCERVKELVHVGDAVALYGPPVSLLGETIVGKSFDDRAGIAAILYAVDKVSKSIQNIDIEIMASTQEEVGGRGAQTGSYLAAADVAIVVDTGHAKTPDASEDRTFEMGGGVMIGAGPNMHPEITKRLMTIAKEKEIPHQIEVMGGDTGTNAWVMQVVRSGIGCGLLSIPLRYMHTTIESISMKDFYATGDLIAAFLQEYDEAKGLESGEVNR